MKLLFSYFFFLSLFAEDIIYVIVKTSFPRDPPSWLRTWAWASWTVSIGYSLSMNGVKKPISTPATTDAAVWRHSSCTRFKHFREKTFSHYMYIYIFFLSYYIFLFERLIIHWDFIHTGVDLKRAHPTIEASSVIRKRGLISTLPRLPTI